MCVDGGRDVIRDSDIVVNDLSGAARAREDVRVPRERRHAAPVARHRPHQLLLGHVPKLHRPTPQAHRKDVA